MKSPALLNPAALAALEAAQKFVYDFRRQLASEMTSRSGRTIRKVGRYTIKGNPAEPDSLLVVDGRAPKGHV